MNKSKLTEIADVLEVIAYAIKTTGIVFLLWLCLQYAIWQDAAVRVIPFAVK